MCGKDSRLVGLTTCEMRSLSHLTQPEVSQTQLERSRGQPTIQFVGGNVILRSAPALDQILVQSGQPLK